MVLQVLSVLGLAIVITVTLLGSFHGLHLADSIYPLPTTIQL